MSYGQSQEDLDHQIALAVSLMKSTNRCGKARYRLTFVLSHPESTITGAEVCTRIHNHQPSDAHSWEDVRKTIPFNWDWRPSDHA